VSARIGDLVKLDGPTLIALRGISAVHRDLDATDSEPTEIILEGGAKIRVSRLAGEFVRREWEFWSSTDDQKHSTLTPLTAEQVKAALHEGYAERKVAEGDNAWMSIMRQRDRLAEALAETLDGWGAALAKTGEYDEKAFDRITELSKLVKR
jgi:hypothetical protein